MVPQGEACLEFGDPMEAGQFANSALNGPSGMVASRKHPGVLYAQLDAGGDAKIYAASTSGADLGDYTLDGLSQTDWEDIAVGQGVDGKDYIFIGDIGDNAAGGMGMGGGGARTEIQIYRVAEPDVSDTQSAVHETVSFDTLRFTYPDGAQNSETLLVDPVSHDFFIMTKTANEAIVYRAPGDTPVDTPTVLEEVARASVGSSTPAAGDISPSGDRILIRTYEALLLWPRASGMTVADALGADPVELSAADEPRSEGVTFSADGSAWYSAGEEDNTLWTASATCK
jgi:hypothetical protein